MRTIVVFIILLTVASTGAWSQADTPLVVLLYSYHRAAWSDAVHEGVLSVFGTGDETLIQTADGLATAFLIRTEYMDTKWIESPAYLDSLEELYSAKYGGRKIVAVMAVDDHAYRFAIQRDCFGGAPVFFCGVNAPLADTLGRRTSGVRETADFGPSIDWALKLFPKTKRLILVEDSTDTGQTNSAEFIALAAKSYPKLELVRTQAMSFEQLQNTLYTPQENTIAFFNAFWRDSSGANISVNELSLVFQHASVPVFGRSQWMMGLGLVGGLCVIGQDQGRAMAQLLFDYLSTGQFKPGAQDSPNRFMVDWLQLKKFSGQPALVPHNAILLNKPEPFVKRYGPVLIPLLLTIIVILTATILLALLSIKLRAARNTAAGSLAEKEILLKEVHHRVKNNLQVMKSLFNLQRRGTDPILEAAFNSASNRLHAMATVHDHLYRDGMFSSIDLVAYANDMADEIKGVYAQSLHNCQIAVIGGFVQLGIDHAVPVGLFLNEALTNAVKYAPVDAAHPLEVHIAQEHGRVSIAVIDHGPGFPQQKSDGLGLTLMRAMADQLHGTLSFLRENGFTVLLSFPADTQYRA